MYNHVCLHNRLLGMEIYLSAVATPLHSSNITLFISHISTPRCPTKPNTSLARSIVVAVGKLFSTGGICGLLTTMPSESITSSSNRQGVKDRNMLVSHCAGYRPGWGKDPYPRSVPERRYRSRLTIWPCQPLITHQNPPLDILIQSLLFDPAHWSYRWYFVYGTQRGYLYIQGAKIS